MQYSTPHTYFGEHAKVEWIFKVRTFNKIAMKIQMSCIYTILDILLNMNAE